MKSQLKDYLKKFADDGKVCLIECSRFNTLIIKRPDLKSKHTCSYCFLKLWPLRAVGGPHPVSNANLHLARGGRLWRLVCLYCHVMSLCVLL